MTSFSDEPWSDGRSAAPQEEWAPLWTVTFGDMMSLLLTFFILLFSMSEIRVEEFRQASESLREAMGGAAPVDSAAEASPAPVAEDWSEKVVEAYVEMLARRLEQVVEEQALQHLVRVAREGDGVYLRIQSGALFAPGSAMMDEAGRIFVGGLAEVTRDVEVGLSVSGHADDQPIQTAQFPSNWELSAARAAGVARVLVEEGHPPGRVRVESWGEFRPVASNLTEEGRAENRRVELFYSRDDIQATIRAWGAAVKEDNP